MKINQIIVETSTTAGSVATVSKPLGEVNKRPQVSGLEPAEKVMKGSAKKKGPYANSLSEGAIKDAETALVNHAQRKIDHEKKYGPMSGQDLYSHEQTRKRLLAKKKAAQAAYSKKMDLEEAELSEDDIIMIPGKGLKVKPGFHKIDPDKAEHEGLTLKNSLHTIIRVATHLENELSVRDNFPEWVSEKVGAIKSNMVTVMDYLISHKEMDHEGDMMEDVPEYNKDGYWDVNLWGNWFGGKWHDFGPRRVAIPGTSEEEARAWIEKNADKLYAKYSKLKGHNGRLLLRQPAQQNLFLDKTKFIGPSKAYKVPPTDVQEGAKVDRMVKHIEKSEKKLGKSSKEAENIAWATANKRGMLDNKNKKK